MTRPAHSSRSLFESAAEQGPPSSANTGFNSPGKRVLAEGFAPALATSAIQRRAAASSEAATEGAWDFSQLSFAALATRRGDSGATGALTRTAAAGMTGPGSALPHADKIQQAFGPGHDTSSIQAHIGGRAAEAAAGIGAEAYAMGNQVAFDREPSLHTAAHEAAHVMQQRQGVQLLGGVASDGDGYERNADEVADRVVAGQSAADLLPIATGSSGTAQPAVQMRRLPTNPKEMLTDPADASKPGANFKANSSKMWVLIERAEAELTPAEKSKVDTEALAGKSWAEFGALPEQDRLIRRANAITKIRPDLKLGDPKLIDSGARGTSEKSNLKTLLAKAGTIFDDIAGGAYDKDLGEVFGVANVAKAKTKYAAGKVWMQNLGAKNKIVTDRSGYSDEIGLGGLTSFQEQIAMMPSGIDQPDNPESILTMIHEALHAGNADVSDKGYISQPSFTELAEDVKLTNAAHFEVVPRRSLKTDFAFVGKTFIPAGATVGGVTAPKLTATEEAIRAASEALRTAWSMSLNLHIFYTNLYKDQTLWDQDLGSGQQYSHSLPYWSKVEKMTLHEKISIDPKATDPAKQPISQIDMALSEGVIRKFSAAMNSVPQTEADATAFENANSNVADQKTAHASVAAHTTFLIKLVLQQSNIAPITGSVDRDQRVVEEFIRLNSSFDTVLTKKDLNGFQD
jgi:hypothetical protein